jgi:hypothetical protein
MLSRIVFGDSSAAAGWLARITNLDFSYSRLRSSSFARAGNLPSLGYQLAFGSFGAFRRTGGILATAASDNATLASSAAVAPGLGIRATATYRSTRGVTWALRTDQQLPLRTRSQEWPSGAISWQFSPAKRGWMRIISSLSTQLTFRRAETTNEQPTFGGIGEVSRTRTIDRLLAPAIAITWTGGILTTFDASRARGEQLSGGSLFRTTRQQRNGALTWSFRPPAWFGRWRSIIRTTLRYSTAENATCLRRSGQTTCVPYVDSRHTQGQLTMDTDLPSNMSAGLQMAYLLNEERQTNRRTAQLLVTAFVQLSTSVGQLR